MSQSPTAKTSRRTKRGIGLVLAAMGCIGAFWYGLQTDEVRSLADILTVEPKFLQFGTVWEQGEFAWELPIRNQGDHQLEIVRFATSCPCVARIEPASFTILPRQTASVRVAINLVRGSETRTERDTRNFSMRIIPDLRDVRRPHPGWVITGRTREATRFSSRQVVFWNDVVRGQTAHVESIDLTSAVPLKRLAVKLDPSVLTVEVVEIPPQTQREKGREFRLNVTPKNSMPSGPFSEEFVVEPIAESGEKLPSWTVKATGTMVEAIQAFPRMLEFGVVPLGEIRSALISLRSSSGNEFAVEKTKTSTESIRVEKQKTGPSEQTFEITQRAVALGSQSAEVRFLIHDEEKRKISVVIEAHYYATSQQQPTPKTNLDH